ncbi:tRNA (adenosine(37)-N6)-threonylcarbamoyltransferase complex ATPase subunit type 1 TsaE [Mesorhizobium sp.]|uniref:tRNA (adenosine(37)-N6)-threonylcarbamoyltransferase complex ATPase subunit type 1 TsaE n=1 Tax=Mesorhizobium sp. TaxID=1871066 RepID=UPI000FE59FD8|nr:tRNA (adenosine(37)-N6)-threonylcarbamoyltransferase complex ATPase subunit type 1 TsaE [Mesorhizobium sp.]RWD36266.1 MAG: tRNA (adenosine(37)-N6)-threonylcarbamoyltransferase complex ATPase subunit type 1 TsaE [Mesorhizobium sp.]RWD45294.1 MAG: tRNA (adenosine(37)-N6)-threonylcarbamoyltransferase complex ATPase subunit type 1 TsaE [Mesorhizobium sp.]RWD79975.1 MAG: tRNA (adenosine(37)-N6)-threonylcarbamoyltransferase complex ATPase subunit type 1 TsaE [Mesorhizobium sp.]TIS42690.1 MAG: tRNA
MAGVVLERFLADEAATARLGEDLAMSLRPGDVLALKGDLGAGKSSLARALIRAMTDDSGLDVPSPTFTLVQSYEARIPVHHFDLYRLSSASELDELGFDEALAQGAALVEWPERAEDYLPETSVLIELVHQDDGRLARLSGQGAAFERAARSLAMRDFLERAGWGEAQRRYFTGDASARSYEIVSLADLPPRVLMNSPRLVLGPPVRDGRPYAVIAHTAQSVSAFVAIDRALRAGGISAPEIHAQDLDQGFLLLEHLGSEGFLGQHGQPVAERYAAAAELLAMMHGKAWPDRIEVAPGVFHDVPPFDRDAMMIEAELLVDWYVPAISGGPASDALRAGYNREWDAVLNRLEGREYTLMLRDFHSPNIIWRGDRTGHDRLGIVDVQDALIGPSAYDLASLAMDARVTLSPEIERRTLDAYIAARHKAGAFNEDEFVETYAIMAAQRNSKILGIFVRLEKRDGKPYYLKHLPRIRDYLRRALAHPGLANLRDFYAAHGFLEERSL